MDLNFVAKSRHRDHRALGSPPCSAATPLSAACYALELPNAMAVNVLLARAGLKLEAAMERLNSALGWMLELVFGCHHRALSRVFTIKNRTYRVCLGCGRQFEYAWETMSMLSPQRRPWYVPANIVHQHAGDPIAFP